MDLPCTKEKHDELVRQEKIFENELLIKKNELTTRNNNTNSLLVNIIK